MRTTIELSDRNYRRLRATAVERGLRGFSPIIEDAVERLLDQEDTGQELSDAMAQAEGAWSEADVAEWELSLIHISEPTRPY